ncbi:MAG: NAD-dependent epimerase [Planctomycetaceae bacterium]|nr:NAD-dependent epimerase [Planctomycetaceae bacterium]
MKKILVTGSAGFIGFHITNYLLKNNWQIIGLDNLNDYYNVKLKKDRLQQLLNQKKEFEFIHADIIETEKLETLFKKHSFDTIIHLAAQAGVRYSLENPRVYIDSNIVGFLNILECCRKYNVKHLIYASSSSVYGLNTKQPFSEKDPVDHPASLYAATKKSNELMAHTYSHLFGLPTTGLRFFTVYGPWGRPDMAIFKFTKAILENKPIDVYNNGKMKRDFTYIDDIVDGIICVVDHIPTYNSTDNFSSPATSKYPFRIYNIGNNKPVELLELISILESTLGRKAKLNLLPMQSGDVMETYADISRLNNEIGFTPVTNIETGIKQFVDWYSIYYQH